MISMKMKVEYIRIYKVAKTNIFVFSLEDYLVVQNSAKSNNEGYFCIVKDNLDRSISSYTMNTFFSKCFRAYYFCSPTVIFLAHYIYGCSFSTRG